MQRQTWRVRQWCWLVLVSCGLSLSVVAAESATPRRLNAILKDIKSAETDVYKVFNDINSDDQFDFVCYSYEETGSKLRRRTCEPQFMRTARKREADRFMEGRQTGTDRAVPMVESGLQFSVASEMAALQQELQRAMQQNPDMTAKMDRLQAFIDEYTSHPRAQKDEPTLGFLARYLLRTAQ